MPLLVRSDGESVDAVLDCREGEPIPAKSKFSQAGINSIWLRRLHRFPSTRAWMIVGGTKLSGRSSGEFHSPVSGCLAFSLAGQAEHALPASSSILDLHLDRFGRKNPLVSAAGQRPHETDLDHLGIPRQPLNRELRVCVVAAITVFALVAYVGLYALIVTPATIVTNDPARTDEVVLILAGYAEPLYVDRFNSTAQKFLETAFSPAHKIDRQVRPSVWGRRPRWNRPSPTARNPAWPSGRAWWRSCWWRIR
jgi:hypothetical protein